MKQPPKFRKYTVESVADLPVTRWEPGLSAIPEEWYGADLNAVLATHGFDLDRPENVRTGLLTADWNGHPATALVVATCVLRNATEPFVVSEGGS